jgi:hypothetical protein
MNLVLPPLAKYAVAVAAAAVLYVLGMLHGERGAGQQHIEYVQAQAARGVAIAKAQSEVVVRTEIKYRDRIKTIYVKGEEIEKQIPVLVSPADDLQPGVSVGFVRSYNAAWSGEPAGPAAGTDRDAAGIPLTEFAETDAHNATACLAWRELALGVRDFYLQQQSLLK